MDGRTEHRAAQPGFADVLRERTRALHARAEQSGMIREVLQGRADRFGYALLLRNLLPAYRCLEAGLERNRDAPGLGRIASPAVYRTAALEADLARLGGAAWHLSLPLLPSAERYAGRVTAAAEDGGARLIAHAYVRYLGDLSGGRVLRRRLVQSLGLAPAELSFYEFPDVADLNAFRTGYRHALDRAASEIADVESVIGEAMTAFELNIDVSNAVHAAARARIDAAGCPGEAR